MNTLFSKRFGELEVAHQQFRLTPDGYGAQYCPSGSWEGWATSAENLIRAIFGETSPHYKNFKEAYVNCGGFESNIKTLIAVFKSAKEDFEGGYVFNVDLRVSGEVFGDFVSLAKTSLAEGQKDVAAVLACAALEDAIKRLAIANGIVGDGKTMQDVVNALKSAGVVSGAQKSLLDAMPKIRNMAMHAEWGKITEPDVSSVIGYVEQLLLSKFSGA
ncbi:MAG: DUF4145 domain-containing protein [Planctomycetaceae bacterium]|nr:DUF4145 domain-containing protein [Planctomycetaceae bacterium]